VTVTALPDAVASAVTVGTTSTVPIVPPDAEASPGTIATGAPPVVVTVEPDAEASPGAIAPPSKPATSPSYADAGDE